MVYLDNSNKDQGNGNHDVGCFQWCTWTTPTKIRVMVIMMWAVFNGVLGQLQQRSWNGNHDVGCFQWCTWTTPTKIRGMVIMMWGVFNGVLGQLQQRSGE